jgi:hypothetical protein
MGYFSLPRAKKLKKIIKVFQSCLPTIPAYFPFEIPFLVTLEPPRFTKGHFPRKYQDLLARPRVNPKTGNSPFLEAILEQKLN